MWRYLLLAVAAGVVGGGAAALYVAWRWSQDLPSLEALENLSLTATTTVYARDGTPIATLASVEDGRAINRSLVRLSEVSPAAVAAVVASEDRRFFQHYGIDWIRLLGGLYNTLRGDLQGGSTITTQVVKNTVLRELATTRSLERKFKEFPLALELERRYSKEEILEMYLNVVFWGGNLTGIRAAAEAYFGKDPSELTLAEGAYLAVLIPAPNERYKDLEGARRRIRRLLDQMVEDGWITPAEAEAAWRQPLVPKGWEARYDAEGNLLEARLVDPSARVMPELAATIAPHFVFEVRKELLRRFGPQKVFGQGGLRVYTTLDLGMQNAAEAAAAEAVEAGRLPDGAQLAIVGLDPEDGRVYAMVGARPGTVGEFNRATQLGDGIGRSPGSAVKPFVYATALEAGWTQATTVEDSPVEYPDPTEPDGVWSPKNFDGTFLNRPVTIRYALDRSLNVPAVRTAEAIGLERVVAKLRAAGFTVPKHPGLAVAIGGVEVTPLRLAAAYASFINGGYVVEPQLIERVEDAEGRVLYQMTPTRKRIWDEVVAYLGWDMLKGYVYDPMGGLARRARIPGRVVGGKTGTSNEARDLWFAGVTRGLSAVVWVGRDDNKPLVLNGRAPSSSVVNPPIWKNFVEEALRGRPGQDFPPPKGLVGVSIDLLSGEPSPQGTLVFFRAERVPARAAVPVGAHVLVGLEPDRDCIAGVGVPSEAVRWKAVPPDEVDRYRCR
ncbi:transglycosylase domain-containing protein [Marinithermus hydrothermalis]|uniref:peptidoglycan glycosyltransferase n=1 Tax=Marinithermus hydrothermalis (strain DSM 14884 / JCM 11576 / T1) TaxID=869210 RepID=F2NNV4_MARHT|nr:transglycosylase domain-containing protein [Marinithermus hydrothermalis]AEB11328.1 penicillin-binding protein, 1A family [Marinithermus hydrothermalis DSM 14884]